MSGQDYNHIYIEWVKKKRTQHTALCSSRVMDKQVRGPSLMLRELFLMKAVIQTQMVGRKPRFVDSDVWDDQFLRTKVMCRYKVDDPYHQAVQKICWG